MNPDLHQHLDLIISPQDALLTDTDLLWEIPRTALLKLSLEIHTCKPDIRFDYYYRLQTLLNFAPQLAILAVASLEAIPDVSGFLL